MISPRFCDGCMEAVYFGSGYGGGGKGPWVGADLENGIYGGKYVTQAAAVHVVRETLW